LITGNKRGKRDVHICLAAWKTCHHFETDPDFDLLPIAAVKTPTPLEILLLLQISLPLCFRNFYAGIRFRNLLFTLNRQVFL
jgi:hypothetical protein